MIGFLTNLKRSQWLTIYFFTAIIITGILFGRVLTGGYFFSDDFTWIWHGSRIASGEFSVMSSFMPSNYSPVLNIFYALFSTVFKMTAWPYFLAGLLAHVLVSVTVGLLVKEGLGDWRGGLIAVALFAFTNNSYEPLVWIAANMHIFACLFITLSILFLLYYFKYSRHKYLFLFLSFVFGLLAVGTKEVAIILLPIIFLVSLYFLFVKKNKITWPLAVYYVLNLILFGVYGHYQYVWQKSSVWVAHKVWAISLVRLLKIPLSIINAFLPVQLILNQGNAIVFLVLTVLLLATILFYFRRNYVVWFGMCWAVLAALPVTFFETEHWWSLLASRYNYTLRAGIVIALSAIIMHLRVVKARKVLTATVLVIVIFQAIYAVWVFKEFNKEYAYVYATGRTLEKAAEELRVRQPTLVLVAPGRPFEQNVAHIVGVLDVVSRIPERNIKFLSKGEAASVQNGEALLKWNGAKKKYEVTYGI